MAQNIVFSSVTQYEICELLSYNKTIWFPEAHLWKQAMDEKVS